MQDDTGGIQAFADPPLGLANVGDTFGVTGYKDFFNGFQEIQYTNSPPSISAGTERTPETAKIANYNNFLGKLVTTKCQIVAYAPGASSGNAYTIIDGTGATAELF